MVEVHGGLLFWSVVTFLLLLVVLKKIAWGPILTALEDREKEIIAYTGMAGPDETVTVEFTAPETPGKYDYICTFPGHYLAGMKGVLIINDL